MERWKFPPCDLELNEEIALAIDACVSDNLLEYTLDLTRQQLLAIDAVIRHDLKNSMMAKGRDILLKVFRARRELAFGYLIGGTDRSFEEVTNASPDRNPDQNSHDNPESST